MKYGSFGALEQPEMPATNSASASDVMGLQRGIGIGASFLPGYSIDKENMTTYFIKSLISTTQLMQTLSRTSEASSLRRRIETPKGLDKGKYLY